MYLGADSMPKEHCRHRSYGAIWGRKQQLRPMICCIRRKLISCSVWQARHIKSTLHSLLTDDFLSAGAPSFAPKRLLLPTPSILCHLLRNWNLLCTAKALPIHPPGSSLNSSELALYLKIQGELLQHLLKSQPHTLDKYTHEMGPLGTTPPLQPQRCQPQSDCPCFPSWDVCNSSSLALPRIQKRCGRWGGENQVARQDMLVLQM